MSNELDNFEKAIRESLDSHEAPYNAEHWKDMSSRLDQLPASGGSSVGPWVVAASIGAALITTAVILYNTVGNEASNETAELQNTEIIEDQQESNDETINETIISDDVSTTSEDQSNTVSEDVEDNGSTAHIEENATTDQGTTISEDPTTNDVIDQNGSTTELAAPEADFTVSASEVCIGEEVTFRAMEVNDHLAFEWNFGDGNSSTKVQPSHLYNSGEFTPTLTVTDVRSGKTTTNSIGTVQVNNVPELSFRWSIDESDMEPSYLFENTSKATDVTWTFGDGSTSTESNPAHDYDRKGLYDVSLTATNDFGCTSSVSQKVPVDRLYNLFVQNAFTPNGDGDNDFFMPKGLEVLDVTFQMSIYNAKGELVFETDNYNNPWDGLLNDGNMIQDTYVWIVVMRTPDGEEDIHRGTITLIK